jgi:hypothetical protein
MTKENVLRVMSHFDEDAFNGLFPIADDFYTYENFLRAVAKFPAFCNEYNADEPLTQLFWTNTADLDSVCKRELSALFAHIAFESGKNDPWDNSVD